MARLRSRLARIGVKILSPAFGGSRLAHCGGVSSEVFTSHVLLNLSAGGLFPLLLFGFRLGFLGLPGSLLSGVEGLVVEGRLLRLLLSTHLLHITQEGLGVFAVLGREGLEFGFESSAVETGFGNLGEGVVEAFFHIRFVGAESTHVGVLLLGPL